MRRDLSFWLGPACASAVLLVCFRAVLFQGEQFAFRDAGYFYYPLYLRVQQEWQAGRWPLWDPWQCGGQPLLGSPMAAVLYPGKLLYAALPYAWAARLYVVGHTALAFAGLVALARSLGVSWAGSALGGLGYAFGAPVLFQYNNVIFLVGAAWLPWGLRAVDAVVRLRRTSGVAGLAAVLALQALGGDPQAAYLTALCGAGYAVVLAVIEGRGWSRRATLVVAGLVAVWVLATPALAYWRPAVPGWVGAVWGPVLVFWVGAGGWVVLSRRRRPGGPFVARMAGLAGAAGLALAVAAAQLVPVAEYSMLSSRVGGNSPVTASKFSVEPFRLVECLWPDVFGRVFPENRSWAQAVPPANDRQIWEPSLYVGGLVAVLALGGLGFRGGPPWRAWLTAVAAISLLASFGRFGGPLWWARWLPAIGPALGPHDPVLNKVRTDAFLYDSAGSVYALLSATLPGFGLFRYPAKLLTLTAAAVAVLAGLGWDTAMAGRSKWLARASLVGLAASLLGLALAVALRGPAVAFLSERVPPLGTAGPPDVAAALSETQRALAHGAAVYAAGLVLALRGPRRPGWAGAAALCALAVDLGLANAPMVWTAPQASFDTLPEAVRWIARAERADPSTGPFRIFRLPIWYPERFMQPSTPARVREQFDWERDTLQPLHGLPFGLEYCVTLGVMELDDTVDFFRYQMVKALPEAARELDVPVGHPICYYPRRSYDLWGARYLILPARALGWDSEARGFASFLHQTEVIAPKVLGPVTRADRERWAWSEDWQLVRNKTAYPRAWLVHAARVAPPVRDRKSRGNLLREIVFQNDMFWSEPLRPQFNPRDLAWIETDDPNSLKGYLAPVPVEPGESVTVTRYEPQRVELRAVLNRPGLVVLADTFYPGWRLTIDGRPATILRANRAMRGAAVPAGGHTLVYTYEPWSFRVGLAVTPIGLAALLVVVVRGARRGRRGGATGVEP